MNQNLRFDPLQRPDRYDDRLETELHSEAASRAACGVESIYPPGYHRPTDAEIRAEAVAHERRMAKGASFSASLDHMRHDPVAFRLYILSPKFMEDYRSHDPIS